MNKPQVTGRCLQFLARSIVICNIDMFHLEADVRGADDVETVNTSIKIVAHNNHNSDVHVHACSAYKFAVGLRARALARVHALLSAVHVEPYIMHTI